MLSPVDAITEPSIGYCIILLDQLFQDEGNIIPVSSPGMSPMFDFTCYKMSFFARSNVVENTMKVIRHSVNPQMVVLAETLKVEKAKLQQARQVLF